MCLGCDVDRDISRETVGGSCPVRSGVGVADYTMIARRDEVWMADEGCAHARRHLTDLRRLVLKRNRRRGDDWRVDALDVGCVLDSGSSDFDRHQRLLATLTDHIMRG